ncbi:MAG: HAD hydrolase family protein [Caulobacter sp.]|nr:HAD hydrolase family protein [Caulobacter sp.]
MDSLPFDLVVYDFDGVMTDNRVLVLEDGREAVFVSRSDGWAVARMREAGLRQIILSTEENPVVAARGRKLRIPVIHGSTDKRRALLDYLHEHGLDPARTVFVGNDVNDLGAMSVVGFVVAPADSHPDVLARADHVLHARGGAHAVRAFYETFVLKVTPA